MLVQYNKQWELNTEWCTLPLDVENFTFEEYWRKPMYLGISEGLALVIWYLLFADFPPQPPTLI